MSVIIPAFNEQESIVGVLEELLQVFPDGSNIEILVVDDGSTDGTGEKIEGFRQGRREWKGKVELVHHPINRGYGAALKSGIRATAHPNIVLIDADGTYSPEAIPELVEALKTHEMAVGARTGAHVHLPWLRRPAKWLLTQLANYLMGVKIPDLNSGLRAFRKSALEPHMRLLPDGFSFTTTMTLALMSQGSHVLFRPIDYRPRTGQSKIHPLRDTLNFFALIIRTVIFFRPLKVFFPLSLLFLFAAAAIFFWSWHCGRILDATVSILFMTGVQVGVLGLLADLVVRRSSP